MAVSPTPYETMAYRFKMAMVPDDLRTFLKTYQGGNFSFKIEDPCDCPLAHYLRFWGLGQVIVTGLEISTPLRYEEKVDDFLASIGQGKTMGQRKVVEWFRYTPPFWAREFVEAVDAHHYGAATRISSSEAIVILDQVSPPVKHMKASDL